MMQEDGPVLSVDFFDSFVRQSMHVDLAQFIEPPPPLPRILPQRQRQKFPNDGRSIVAVVDKVALLKSLETKPDDETAKAKALAVAHDEDISAWVEVIAHCFLSKQVESLSLVELLHGVQYPVVEGEEERSPLIKTWLALLLGGFKMEQGDNFYSLKGILVEMP